MTRDPTRVSQPVEDTPDFPAILERERCLVAEGVSNVKKAISQREWLTEGRGSYEYNDDRWHGEFAAAIREILEALKPLERVAADLAHCPPTWEGAQKARSEIGVQPILGHLQGALSSVEDSACEHCHRVNLERGTYNLPYCSSCIAKRGRNDQSVL